MNDLKIQVKYTTTNINGVLTENCTYLDLYEFDIPKITISIEDIVSTNLKTPYTNTFRVPNSNTNAQFFRDVFDINGIDFDVTKVVDCYIIVDDNIFTFGELRLNKVHEYELENRVDYEVVFIGRLRNFVSKLSDKTLNDLDWEGWTYSLDYTTITNSWSAYPETGLTANGGIVVGDGNEGDIIFPLVDFGTNINPNLASTANTSMSVFTQLEKPYEGMKEFITNNFSSALGTERFRPMVRVKKVFDKIMEEAGFDYESEFMNSDLLKNLYISAWGNNESEFLQTNYLRLASILSSSENNQLVRLTSGINFGGNFPIYNTGVGSNKGFNLLATKNADGTVPSNLNDNGNLALLDNPLSFVDDYENNSEDNHYVALESGEYQYTFKMRLDNNTTLIYQPTIFLWDIEGAIFFKKVDINGVETFIGSIEFSKDDFSLIEQDIYIIAGYQKQVLNLEQVTNFNLNEGDKLYAYMEFSYSADYPFTGVSDDILTMRFFNFRITKIDSNQTELGGYFDNDYKQIDFIKDISTKFRLVFDEDKTQPNKFKIEPFNNYVAKDVVDIFDWTDKLDISKPQEIKPIFYTQKQEIDFLENSGTDMFAEAYKDSYNENYGSLNVFNPNDLLIGKREVKPAKFVSTPNTQIRGYNTVENEGYSFLFPVIAKQDNRGASVPIKPSTSILFYNGRVDTGDLIWYMQEDVFTQDFTGFTKYPLVSQWQNYPLQFNTLWFNWSKEYPFNRATENGELINNFTQGETVYDRYWKDYIEYLYDKDSRIYTAYFKLNAFDLFTFNFSKIIQVKSNFYYVNKIENMPLTGDNIVKVELIKLNGFTPPYQIAPPVVGQVWNTTDQVWNTTDNTWDD